MRRVDDIGFGGLRLLQNSKAFCYGVDAVLLADFAARNANSIRPPRAPKSESTRRLAGSQESQEPASRGCGEPAGLAVDLGAGTGIIPLILSHKTNCESIYGIELQKPSFELFEENIKLNSLQNRLIAINADITDLPRLYPEFRNKFDLVTANPPYVKGGAGLTNLNLEKKLARHESTAGIFEFVQIATDLLADNGAFFMIHRPSRLFDIFEALSKCNLRAEILQFVATDEETESSMVLIKSGKSAKELRVQKPLYIYDRNRNYTENINIIYER